jgi:hypothetical protein
MTPDSLRKRAAATIERLELERVRQEELRRVELEKERLEAEQLRIVEKENARKKVATLRAVALILKIAIQAAAQGKNSAPVDFPPELTNEVCASLKGRGIDSRVVRIRRSGASHNVLNGLDNLLEILGRSQYGEPHITRLKDARHDLKTGMYFEAADVIEQVMSNLRKDKYLHANTDDITLCAVDQLEPLLNSLHDEKIVQGQEVSWRLREVNDFVFTALHDVPAWLLSTGGAGTLKRINECMVTQANEGKTEATFQLEELPVKPERWNQNKMTKLIYRGQPVGVTPFNMKVFSQMLDALGFKAELKVQDSGSGNVQSVSIFW